MQLKNNLFCSLMMMISVSGTASAQVVIPKLDYYNGVGLATGQSESIAEYRTQPGHLVPFRVRPGAEVELNWSMLSTLDPSSAVRVSLPGPYGQFTEVVLIHNNYRSDDDYEWVGQIAGRAYSEVFIARYKDGFHATIRDYDAGTRWSIEGDSFGRYYVLDGNTNFQDDGPACDPGVSSPFNAPVKHGDQTSTQRGNSTVSDPDNTVDIMTVATQQVLQNVGANNFVAICRVAVIDFNNRAINSRVTSMSPGYIALRLVAVDTVSGQDYVEIPATFGDGSSDPDFGGSFELNLLGAGNSALSTEISLLREECKADLVAVCRWSPWIGSFGGNPSVAGIAFRPTNQEDLDNKGTYWSVNSMNHASLDFIGDIFAHEVGHNLALVHDPLQYLADIDWEFGDPPAPPASELSSRPHGFKGTCENGCVVGDLNFHTTMAYGVSSSCGRSTLTPYFSSPQYSYDPGALCPSYVVGNSGLSWASELMILSSEDISQYKIGAVIKWVAPGGSGLGTYLDPYGNIVSAVNNVQGDISEAKVRIRSGDYNVSGAILLNNTATLTAEGGNVVIR